ncbi:hypothetical protein BH09VER1_BH09VER1_24810 [soil metagenome]
MTAIELATIPEAARREIFRWKEILEELLCIKPGRAKAFHDYAQRLNMPEPTLRSKFYAFQKRGIAALVDRRLCGPQAWNTTRPAGLSLADRELVKRYCEENQRGNKVAIRALLRDWRKGVVTSQAPLDPTTGYPVGWSERNLLRFAPTKFELKASRIGRSAAAAHRQLVYTTRANLWVGSHYMFDDMWHDHECNDLDRQKRGRPLEFHALDLYSANKFAWGMLLRTESDEGKMEGLKNADMRFLLAAVLGNFGYSQRGTVLIVEHGTAAIPDWLEDLILKASGGVVTVDRSGMQGAAAHSGQYAGRSKGNFKFKAALESLGNLIHNEMAMLPGQTGLDRQHSPEQQHGLQKYNDALLCAISQLSAERIEMLQWDLRTIQQFQVIASEVYQRINARTEHKLEGWDLNYVPDRRTGRMRRMAPVEVFNRGRQGLQTFAPEALAMILGLDCAEERIVRRGMVEIAGSEVTGDLLRFSAAGLREGEKFQAVLNPYRPDALWMFDAKGRYVSALPLIEKANRTDVESVQRAMAVATKVEADLLAPLRARHLGQARKKLAMHRNNAAVISGAPVTVEEKEAARLEDKARKFGRVLVEDEPAPIEEPTPAGFVEDFT